MVHCPLCGAKNPDSSTACSLCDSLLTEQNQQDQSGEGEKYLFLDTVDASSFQLHWRKFALFVAVVIMVALPWVLMAPLFDVPDDVEFTRSAYDSALSNYFKSRDSWDQRKDQLLQTMQQHKANPDLTKPPLVLGDLPLEVLFAYFNDDLDFFRRINSDLAIYPVIKKGEGPRISLSKYQSGLWPMRIILSVDLEFVSEGSKVTPRVIRFRRGSQEASANLAWSYFAPELQVFKQLESMQSGMVDLSMHEKNGDLSDLSSSASHVFFSLKYLPMGKKI
jgi:hypothetical protein